MFSGCIKIYLVSSLIGRESLPGLIVSHGFFAQTLLHAMKEFRIGCGRQREIQNAKARSLADTFVIRPRSRGLGIDVSGPRFPLASCCFLGIRKSYPNIGLISFEKGIEYT